MNKTEDKKTYQYIDFFKFVCAVLVIAIHALPFSGISTSAFYWVDILARIAVPFFFIASGFFLFNNISATKLKNFISRLLKLYLFWFVVTLPHTIYKKFILPESDFATNIIKFAKGVVFSSSFNGSWYVNTLIVSSVIVYFLQKKFSFALILLLGAILYVLSCISSSYMSFYPVDSAIATFVETYKYIFGVAPYTSLPAGLLYVAIGAYIIKNKQSFTNINMNSIIAGLVISIILAIVENTVLYGHSRSNDSFFALVPLCFFLFLYCLKSDYIGRTIGANTLFLRNASTVMYFSQFILIDTYLFILKSVIHSPYINMIVYIVVLITTILLTAAIRYLEKYKLFSWLKYSY